MGEKNFAEKRQTIREQRERSVIESVLRDIDEAILLEKEGKVDSKAAFDRLEAKLQARINEIEKKSVKAGDITIDRSFLPATGEILAENNRVILKMISEDEYDFYMDVSYECSAMKNSFKEEDFKQELWKEFLKEYEVVASIYDKKSGDYVGYCSVKDMCKSDWELAIEEKEQYRNKGYGYDALSMFITTIAKMSEHRFFRARIDIDNTASQKLVKKLGAYPDGISEFMLHGEELIEFQRDNLDCIDDNIRIVAEEFCMEPEDILGHVLEYRIDVENM